MTGLPRAVVLLSGGLDSTTVLALAKAEGFTPYAMSFRYGQRHAVELDSARWVVTAPARCAQGKKSSGRLPARSPSTARKWLS